MDRNSLITIFIQDLKRYRNRYKYLGIFNKFSVFTILLLIGISTFLPPSTWVTVSNVVSLVLYLLINVIKPEKYRNELKERIHNLFEVITKLTKSQISDNQWQFVVDDIIEKGLLLEVQSKASLELINQSGNLRQPQLTLGVEEPSSLEVSPVNTEN